VAIVSLSGVSKSFTPSVKVLKSIDLTINEGEMVGLIGASGSGKSTLLRLICGLEVLDSDAGTIKIFGKTTQQNGKRTSAAAELRTDVGVIFQQFNLVNRLSLLVNVMVGRLGRVSWWRGTFGLFPKADRIKALQALERVGMVDYAHQRASTLSGGQQQRGAIARVLTQEARIILADEPIASLDPASAKHVMKTLRRINEQDGVTIIVSLHQIDHAFEHCDRIIALKAGKIIHSGDTASISQADIAALYGLEEGALELKTRPQESGNMASHEVGDGYVPRPEAAA